MSTLAHRVWGMSWQTTVTLLHLMLMQRQCFVVMGNNDIAELWVNTRTALWFTGFSLNSCRSVSSNQILRSYNQLCSGFMAKPDNSGDFTYWTNDSSIQLCTYSVASLALTVSKSDRHCHSFYLLFIPRKKVQILPFNHSSVLNFILQSKQYILPILSIGKNLQYVLLLEQLTHTETVSVGQTYIQ